MFFFPVKMIISIFVWIHIIIDNNSFIHYYQLHYNWNIDYSKKIIFYRHASHQCAYFGTCLQQYIHGAVNACINTGVYHGMFTSANRVSPWAPISPNLWGRSALILGQDSFTVSPAGVAGQHNTLSQVPLQ